MKLQTMKNYLLNAVLDFLLDLSLWLVIIFCLAPLDILRTLSAASISLRQAFEESLHNLTVVYICDSLDLDIEEVFAAYETIPSIKAKDDFLMTDHQ